MSTPIHNSAVLADARLPTGELVPLVPRRTDVPLAWDALALLDDDAGERRPPLLSRTIEYDPARGVHCDRLHVVGWRQEAAPADPDQNDLWSDFLPSQVDGTVSRINAVVAGAGWRYVTSDAHAIPPFAPLTFL